MGGVDVASVMAMMAASLEGKLAKDIPMDDGNAKLKTLQDLKLLMENVQSSLFNHSQTFPALGYIVSTLLKIISGNLSPQHRIVAGEILLLLLRRCPNDNFMYTVIPGVVTFLLKFFPSWEKEIVSLVTLLLDCLLLLILRGTKRIQQDGKFGIVVYKLADLAPSMRMSDSLYESLLRTLVSLQNELRDLKPDDCKCIIKGISIVVSYRHEQAPLVQAQTPPTIMGLYAERLCEIIEHVSLMDLSKPVYSSSIEILIDELRGILRILPCGLWVSTCSLQRLIKNIASFSQRTFAVSKTKLIDLERFGWDLGLGELAASILEILGASDVECGLDENPDGPDLLVFGQWLKGVLSINVLLTSIDYLIDTYDSFACRDIDPHTQIAMAANDEEYWLICWCSAVNCCIREADIPFVYLLKPLLSLLSFPSFVVKEASWHTLGAIARCCGFSSVESLIQSQSAILLDQIASDIRFPTLFPGAPLQLTQLITFCETRINAIELVSLIRDMEDNAAKYQLYPAYIFALLKCFYQIIEVTTRTRTVLPRRNTEPDLESLDPVLTLEQELMATMIRITVNFLTDDNDRIRLSALDVIASSVVVFKDGQDDDSTNGFLPLAHLTWSPLLARMSDPNLQVARSALRTITIQTEVAGDFLRDRIHRELFPLFGNFLIHESDVRDRVQSMSLLLKILRNMGKVSSQVVKSSAMNIIRLCGTSLDIGTTVELLVALTEINVDQMWFILVVQLGMESEITHPTSRTILPMIDLRPFKSSIELSTAQITAISQTRAKLKWRLN